MLLRWPAAQLFPALDIVRLAVLTTKGAQQIASTSGSLGESSSGQARILYMMLLDNTHT